MSETITLAVPEVLVLGARAVAAGTHRRVEDVLAEWLERTAGALPIESLPDEQVLALHNLGLDDARQAELSDLLARRREGTITDAERGRLDELLDLHGQGIAQRSRALQVAVERGLRPPPTLIELADLHTIDDVAPDLALLRQEMGDALAREMLDGSGQSRPGPAR